MASSIPATSAKVTFFCRSESRRALLFPKLIAFPPPDWSWRMKKMKIPMKRIIGSHVAMNDQNGETDSGSILY